MKCPLALLLTFVFSVWFANADALQNRTYEAIKTPAPIQVDGILNEGIWMDAQVAMIDNYYQVEKPTDKQKTVFKMVWDEKFIYVGFECEDAFITSRQRPRDGAPYFDDCAEIFLTPVPAACDFHYGIEINLLRCSNDFIFLWKYHEDFSNAAKSWDPEFDVAFNIEGTLNDNSDKDEGWSVEMAIPIQHFDTFIRDFPVEAGAEWSFMACRQDRNDAEGDRRSISTLYPKVDENEGVHDPDAFGIVKFVE